MGMQACSCEEEYDHGNALPTTKRVWSVWETRVSRTNTGKDTTEVAARDSHNGVTDVFAAGRDRRPVLCYIALLELYNLVTPRSFLELS